MLAKYCVKTFYLTMGVKSPFLPSSLLPSLPPFLHKCLLGSSYVSGTVLDFYWDSLRISSCRAYIF